MRSVVARPAGMSLGAALAVTVMLTGCGSSGPSGASTVSSAAPSQSPGTASGSAAPLLTKADFVAKMNAVCSTIDAKRKALPAPASPTDYAAVATFTKGTLTLVPQFLSEAEALIAQSPDKAELTAKWLVYEKGDFAVAKPIAERLLAAGNAKDAAAVNTYATKLSQVTDHSSQIASFMTTYGLNTCATLESS